MSNLDKAIELISNAELPGRTLHPLQVEAIGLILKEAGLLAPDLPEPEVRHLEEVGTDVLAWKSDHIEVGVYKNWIAMDDPLESGMTVDESRRLALALLAACEYAEKEQGHER